MPTLADREAGPHPQRGDYLTREAYELAFYTWRQIHWDAVPTRAEREAWMEAACWRLGVPYEPEVGRG